MQASPGWVYFFAGYSYVASAVLCSCIFVVAWLDHHLTSFLSQAYFTSLSPHSASVSWFLYTLFEILGSNIHVGFQNLEATRSHLIICAKLVLQHEASKECSRRGLEWFISHFLLNSINSQVSNKIQMRSCACLGMVHMPNIGGCCTSDCVWLILSISIFTC